MAKPPEARKPEARTRVVAGAVLARRRDGLDDLWPELQPIAEARALALQFQFEASQWWAPERLLRAQLEQARKVIRHAARTVPFYAKRLAAVARSPAGRLTMEAFREIPVLSREEIQDAGPALRTTALPDGHGPRFPTRTSGSTGQPIEVESTALTATMLQALTMRGHLWHGRDLTASSVVFRPSRSGTAAAGPRRWAPLPGGGPSILIDMDLPIEAILDALLEADPVYLQSQPNILRGLLRSSAESGRKPTKLVEVRAYGETLDDFLREQCREIWGVEIVDNYSAEEFGTIAHQCPESHNLHVQAENVLVEVLDDEGRACGPGQAGRVVVTGLHNFATPLIRADIGDNARVGPPCACGRGLPVLEEVLGRQKDLVHRPSGEASYPRVWREFADVPEIRQFQLVQQRLDTIELRLVVSETLSAAAEDRLRSLVNDRLGYDFKLPIVYVGGIERAPGGKYVLFRSDLTEAEIVAREDAT